ncbi:MAG: DUF3175 domain-containing protein [Terriglobales bacterium]
MGNSRGQNRREGPRNSKRGESASGAFTAPGKRSGAARPPAKGRSRPLGLAGPRVGAPRPFESGHGAASVSAEQGQGQGPDNSPRANNRWSQRVTTTSNALDLEPGVFKLDSPRAVAQSLRRSALASDRRKTDPFRSAMSMLNFYINRAGKNLPDERRRTLRAAKGELRRVFHRPAA